MPDICQNAESIDVLELDHDEGVLILDRAARGKLNISGREFLDRWDRGFYHDIDDPDVTEIAILIPFAR